MNLNKLIPATVLAIAIGAPFSAYHTSQAVGAEIPRARIGPPTFRGDGLAAVAAGMEWVNTPPLSVDALRGKVVLVEFWTYSCINWRRQLPYVRAWAEKYKDHGLVVIGVHTPEFAFERDLGGVRGATGEMRITYPVVLDSDYRIWNAFDNHYWPALYFVDATGRTRHHHFGEGDYARSEKILQQLLVEAGAKALPRDLVAPMGAGLEAPPDFANLRTPETYVGYQRAEKFTSPGGFMRNRPYEYVAPPKLALNEWALAGLWTAQVQRATSGSPGGRIIHRFHGRDLHLVIGSQAGPVRFRVLLDGKPPGPDRGTDVDAQGYGTLTKATLYQLIRQGGRVQERTFEIEFLDAGAEAYSFTFG